MLTEESAEEIIPEAVETPEYSELTDTVSSGSISLNIVSNNIIDEMTFAYEGRTSYGGALDDIEPGAIPVEKYSKIGWNFTSANNAEHGSDWTTWISNNTDPDYLDQNDTYAAFKVYSLTSDASSNLDGKYKITIGGKAANAGATMKYVSADIISLAKNGTDIAVEAKRTAYDGKATFGTITSANAVGSFDYVYDQGVPTGDPYDDTDPAHWVPKKALISDNKLYDSSTKKELSALDFENANTLWITDVTFDNGYDAGLAEVTFNGTKFEAGKGVSFNIVAADDSGDGKAKAFSIGDINVKKLTNDAYVSFVGSESSNIIQSFDYAFTTTGGAHSSDYDPDSDTMVFGKDNELTILSNSKKKSTISYDKVTKITISNIVVDGSEHPEFTYAIKVNGTYLDASSCAYLGKSSIDIPIETSYTTKPLEVKIEAVPFKKVTISANDATVKGYFADPTPFHYEVRGGAYSLRDGDDVAWSTEPGATWASFYVEPNMQVSLNNLSLKDAYNFLNPEIKKADGTVIVPSEPTGAGQFVWGLGTITADETIFKLDAESYKLFDKVVLSLDKDQGSYPIVSFNNFLSDDTNATFYGAATDLGVAGKKVSENMVFNYKTGTKLQIKVQTDNQLSRGQEKYYYEVDSIYFMDYVGKKITLTQDSSKPNYFEPQGTYTNVYIDKEAVKDLLYNGSNLELVFTQYRSNDYAHVELLSSPANKIAATMTYEAATVYSSSSIELKESDPSVDGYLPYDEELKIKATPKEGFKLVSISFNEIKSGTTTSLSTNVSSSADIAKVLAGTYTYKIPYKDLRVTFNVEEDYHLHVGYQEKAGSSASLVVEQDKKGNYKVMSNRPVEIRYFKGEAQPDFTYDVLLGKTSILNKVSENGVKKVTKSGVSYLVLDGLNKELAGKTVTVKMTGTATGSKTLEAVFVIDKDNSRSLNFAASDKKSGVTMNMGASKVLSLTPKGVLSVNVTLSNSTIPAGFDTELSADYRSIKIITKAAIVKSYKEPLIVNLKDTYSGEIYDSITVTLTDSIKDSAKPEVTVTGTTNNTVTVSLKPGKGVDTSLDGLYYQITTTVTGTKVNTPLKTTPIVEFVKISEKSHRIDLLKDGADDATKADGDPDATITVKVKVVQVNGDAKTDNIVSAGTEETKDGHPAKGGVFETKLGLKKAASPIKGYYNNVMNQAPDDLNAYNFDVVWSKKTTVQKLESVTITNEAGVDIGENTYYSYTDTSIKFWTRSAGNINLTPGTYTIEAKALEVNGKEVKAVLKVKVNPAITGLSLFNGNPTLIYKKDKAATAKFIAKGNVYNPKLKAYAFERTTKVEWSIVNKNDETGVAPDFVTNKMITIGKRNGTIKINKKFTVDNTKFYVKIKAVDYAGNWVTAYSPQITVKTKFPSQFKLAFSPDNTFTGTLENLPASGLVKDIFSENYDWDKNNYKYVTYVSAYQKDESGATEWVPATYKVSGAKLIETIDVGGGQTKAKIGFTRFGDVKITVTTTDGSDRALKGKQAATVKVNPYSGKLGYMLFDKASNVGNINPNVPADVAKVMAWNVSTDSIKGVQVITTASESAKTVDNYQPAGEALTLVVKAYGKSGNAGVASAADHSISVAGGKLVKLAGMYGQYQIIPNAAETVVTLKNKTTKTNAFKVTITNHAIDTKNAKLKKVVLNTPSNYRVPAKNGKTVDGKGSIFNDILFLKADADNGWTSYDSASFNRVKYTLKDNYGAAEYALVNVLKDDVTPANMIWVGAQGYCPISYSVMAAAKATVDDGAGNAIMKNGSYLVKLTSGNGIKSFTIDYAEFFDSDGDLTKDSYRFAIKAGTYKIGVTPVKLAKDSKGNDYPVTDLKFIATGKENVVNVKAVKTPKAGVKPKASVQWTDKKSNPITDGNYSNIIKRANADKKQSAGGIQYVTTGLKGVNKAGTINNFKTFFKIDETGKLTFVGKAKDSKSEAVDTLDSKLQKDELTGWASFKYQDLSGRVQDGDLKVTLKVANGSSVTTK